MVLIYSQSCETNTTINFRTFHYFPSNPVAFRYGPSISPFLLALRKHQSTLCFYIVANFGQFHINGFILYMFFCDWLFIFSIMFSRLIHIVSALLSFLWPNNISSYEYTTFSISISWWTFGLFLSFSFLNSAINICAHVFGNVPRSGESFHLIKNIGNNTSGDTKAVLPTLTQRLTRAGN